MKVILIRYMILVGATLAVFSNFVACGAQFYQVSMRDDLDDQKIPEDSKDPTVATYGLHSPGGWKALPIRFKVGQRLNSAQLLGLTNAMKSWEWAVNRKLFQFEGVQNIDGDSFQDLNSSLQDFINGDYLDFNWGKTGKKPEVLATTIWQNNGADPNFIDTADIRFNGEYYIIGDSFTSRASETREVVDMESLALHELGHLLGLTHIDASQDDRSIMNFQLFIGEGLSNRCLSKGDISRVQRIYSCEGDACDLDKYLSASGAKAGCYAAPSTASTESESEQG